jgi:excisionase family DNA binding protein
VIPRREREEKTAAGCAILDSMTEEKQFLTTREAGERLGVGIQRVLDLIHAGRLKAEKFGRDWAVDAESVASFKRLKPGPKPKGDKGDSST